MWPPAAPPPPSPPAAATKPPGCGSVVAEDAWISHLDPGLRTFLKQGLTYLSRNAKAGDFPTLKMWDGRISIRVVPRNSSQALGPFFPFDQGPS
jgi:hypothetical protein